MGSELIVRVTYRSIPGIVWDTYEAITEALSYGVTRETPRGSRLTFYSSENGLIVFDVLSIHQIKNVSIKKVYDFGILKFNLLIKLYLAKK